MKTFVFIAILCFDARTAIGTERNAARDRTPEDGSRALTTNDTQGIVEGAKWMSDWNKPMFEEAEIPGDEVFAKSRLTKRQIIKIPSTVTKVKVISSETQPQLRPKRMPPTRSIRGWQKKNRPTTHYVQRPSNLDYDENVSDHLKFHKTRDSEERKMKHKGLIKSQIFYKDVSPEEFYSDVEDFQNLPFANTDTYRSPGNHLSKHHSRKIHKHTHYSDSGMDHLDSKHSPHRSVKWSDLEPDGSNFDTVDLRKPYEPDYSRPIKFLASSYSHGESQHDADDEYGEQEASTIHMTQVAAPNLAGMNVDPTNADATESVRENQFPEFHSKKVSHSVFPQQYTSHNPQVLTNFGLNTNAKIASYGSMQEYPRSEAKSFDPFDDHSVQRDDQIKIGSVKYPTDMPISTSGLQVVQAPQLGVMKDNVPRPTRAHDENQRATIRDILKQDCPQHEVLGYCHSPPRYPTVQISNMIAKCSDLMDAMSAPNPPEPNDDLSYFTKRSDEEDDTFDDGMNPNGTTEFFGFPQQPWTSWMRSGSDSEGACSSEYTIIEPGYAKEVTTGRWFVVVQNSESGLQKVTTDTCISPGKPCSGLAGMKCSRIRASRNGIKITRCIQRYTHQRLVSWDPETPSKCPQIRVFRFPTACVCRLRLMYT